jgi:hypothetical protein
VFKESHKKLKDADKANEVAKAKKKVAATIKASKKKQEPSAPCNNPVPPASESVPYTREPMQDIADGVASGTNIVVGDPLIVLAASMQSIAHSMRIMARATQHNTNLNTQIAQSVSDAARSAKQAVEASTRIADAVTLLAHDYRLVVSLSCFIVGSQLTPFQHSQNSYEDGHVNDEEDQVGDRDEISSLPSLRRSSSFGLRDSE